jgi:hypothetical protein
MQAKTVRHQVDKCCPAESLKRRKSERSGVRRRCIGPSGLRLSTPLRSNVLQPPAKTSVLNLTLMDSTITALRLLIPKSFCLLLQTFQTVNQRLFPVASTVRPTRCTSLAPTSHSLTTWTKGSSHRAGKSLLFLAARPSGKSPLRKRHALSKPLSQRGALLLDLPICFRQRYGVQVQTSRNSPWTALA